MAERAPWCVRCGCHRASAMVGVRAVCAECFAAEVADHEGMTVDAAEAMIASAPLHHAVPENDEREHVTEGTMCPCLPRVWQGVITHNSYDGRETGEACRRALDLLGLALVKHHHTWTPDEREAYEAAVDLLNMHWPEKESAPPEQRAEGA